jgi:hypothetical protein
MDPLAALYRGERRDAFEGDRQFLRVARSFSDVSLVTPSKGTGVFCMSRARERDGALRLRECRA